MDFEELVEQFEPIIKKQIKVLRAYQYNDELYQIGLLAMWDASRNYQEGKGYFPAYIKKYVRGRMLNFLHKERSYYASLSDSPFMEEIVAGVPSTWVTISLRPVLPFLTEREKFWLMEYLEFGKGPSQIAREQNVSVNTVKSWRLEAIKKCKQHLPTHLARDMYV
ncbi:sigma-70 family RNA polymerase sigma factor [Anaerobacillus alkaliphilus]|uniref:Sigma-70 family RNA polymerase sigma factor n=1 Tax=Anaerobacillus alkaliphilus TaxID=1548597 RepID=A0A4V1LGM1_9BACI|nr:sigma-70 family RNA polymerase sigma factor [Anaerobacillus alkaliphilus]RXJ02239.1 sigma-70 family RNA polymerase sigma factor [Anaerobacillus alkaliphilus]